MLWPMMWTGSPPNAARIFRPSIRDRRSTPAIGGTCETRTRLPAAAIDSGTPRKYFASVTGPEADLLEAEQAMRQDDRRGEPRAEGGEHVHGEVFRCGYAGGR